MALAIETFEDLVYIIETHPEWRRQLKRALFDIDIEAALTRLEKAVAELVEIQRQQSVEIKQLVEVQRRQADDIHVLKSDVSQLKTDVASLKGKAYEQEYRLKASGIFGNFLRRGRDRTDDIADQLYDAVIANKISKTERTQVLAADLLWGGKSYVDGTEIIIVLEASWRAEKNDVERATRRADVLRRVGFRTVPIVAGTEWDGQALIQAQALGVVIASNGQVNEDSWNAAVTGLSGQDA
ncbi:MAG: hypothetical protein ACOYNY_27055 [Caldilineaceae bacterium]